MDIFKIVAVGLSMNNNVNHRHIVKEVRVRPYDMCPEQWETRAHMWAFYAGKLRLWLTADFIDHDAIFVAFW